MDEIRRIISAIKNSASSYDELAASILKQCSDSYLEPLTLLINLSISWGIVPDKLKIVILIFKGEDEQLVQNYRPVSALPDFSKKNCKIVATYVIEFLEDNLVCYNYQFAFRKSNSISHAIITLVERVSKVSFWNLKGLSILYVDHTILLRKLWYQR